MDPIDSCCTRSGRDIVVVSTQELFQILPLEMTGPALSGDLERLVHCNEREVVRLGVQLEGGVIIQYDATFEVVAKFSNVPWPRVPPQVRDEGVLPQFGRGRLSHFHRFQQTRHQKGQVIQPLAQRR